MVTHVWSPKAAGYQLCPALFSSTDKEIQHLPLLRSAMPFDLQLRKNFSSHGRIFKWKTQ